MQSGWCYTADHIGLPPYCNYDTPISSVYLVDVVRLLLSGVVLHCGW